MASKVKTIAERVAELLAVAPPMTPEQRAVVVQVLARPALPQIPRHGDGRRRQSAA
jgi:hypothetical protein